MFRSPARIAVSVVVFAVALVGALLLMRSSDPSTGPAPKSATKEPARAVIPSDVWKVGDTWTVKVRQDSGSISPDGESNVAAIPFEFEVTDGPTTAGEPWLVTVTQEGAEGPFANGWRLQYVERDGALVLTKVAVGEEDPLEAELASIVLGPQFPYEVRYAKPPKDMTLEASKLLERSQLPPSALPGGGTNGEAPPAEAPVPGGGAPEPAPAPE